MNTYFIRHTKELDIDDSTRAMLFKGKRIAIHFPWTKNNPEGSDGDSKSLDPNEYETPGKKAVNALLHLAREGGYVCAQYYPYDKYLLGKVSPNSRIERILGRWETKFKQHTRKAVLKTLRLGKCILVEPYSYAPIHIGRPRQGTIMRWKGCGDLIRKLVEGEKISFSYESFDSLDQEIICEEFLRLNNKKYGLPKLISLLGFPGRTMKDIDILGIADDGKRIFAQVTHSKGESIKWKFEHLKKYSNKNARLILFCDCNDVAEIDHIKMFPIKKAIETFLSTSAGALYKGSKLALQRRKK